MVQTGWVSGSPKNIPHRIRFLSNTHVGLIKKVCEFQFSIIFWVIVCTLVTFCLLDISMIFPHAHLLCLQWAGKIRVLFGNQLSCFVPSILVEEVKDLIQQQTLNDTVIPRTFSSYYERYHPLNEVSHYISLQNYYFHLISIAISTMGYY